MEVLLIIAALAFWISGAIIGYHVRGERDVVNNSYYVESTESQPPHWSEHGL